MHNFASASLEYFSQIQDIGVMLSNQGKGFFLAESSLKCILVAQFNLYNVLLNFPTDNLPTFRDYFKNISRVS